jgi:dipeptidyl aminopeptidase/acylaminoacyl peptidase
VKGFFVKLTIALTAIIAVLVDGAGLNPLASASDRWHVAVTPPVDSQEVQFTNGNAHLVGTVSLPRNGNHLPAVVVLHDAGIPTHEAALYRHLRKGLPALGFAVLIYDRRGRDESYGDPRVDYETLADDAIAGQHALARLPRIDPARIGFWGLSQGGWLAVLAAGRSQEAAFAISVSAPLVAADEQMQFATSNLLTLRGYSPSDVREMLETRRAWAGYLRGTNSREVAVDALRKSESKPWFNISYLPSVSRLTTDPEHDPTRRTLDDDPVAAVRKAKVPLLFLYGDSDPWVPVAQSIERLQSLTRELHNIEYAVVAGANHEMMSPVNETMQIDQNTIRNDAPQAPTYFILLGSWLSRHVTK